MHALEPQQARGLLADVAALPLGHDLVAACSVRTQGIVGYLLGRGVPQEALGIAGNFVPDLSARGLHEHYARGAVMHGQLPFAPHSFAERAAHDPDVARQPDWEHQGVARVGDISVHRQAGAGIELPGVSLGHAEGGQRWWVAETHVRQPFANHYAPTVWVSRPGGAPVLMVMDTAQSKRELQTLDQWRTKQGCPEAVSTVAGIGAPFRIHTEALHPSQAARLARHLGLTGPPTARALDARWAQVTDDERRAALTSFFGWTEPPAQDAVFAGYSENLRQTLTSDTPLFPPEREIGTLLDHAVATFAPLETYQAWLRQTDGVAARKRGTRRPPVTRDAAPAAKLPGLRLGPETPGRSRPRADVSSAVALATLVSAGMTPLDKHGADVKYPAAAMAGPVNGPLRDATPHFVENIVASKDHHLGISLAKRLN